jgi:hypothetical protein
MAQPVVAPPAGVVNPPVSGYTGVIEVLGAEVAQYSREAFGSAGETARGLLSARTFEDVVRLQADFAKRSFEGFVTCSAKLSELGFSIFGTNIGVWPGSGGSARAKL